MQFPSRQFSSRRFSSRQLSSRHEEDSRRALRPRAHGTKRVLVGAILTAAVFVLIPAGLSFAQGTPGLREVARAVQAMDELQFDQAATILEHLVSDPNLHDDVARLEAWKYLGICRMALGEPGKAREAFTAALAMDPTTTLDSRYASGETRDEFERARAALIATDVHAPIIEDVVAGPGQVGRPLDIQATVRDDVAVGDVIVFYRAPGDEAYASVKMLPTGPSAYVATIPAEAVSARGVQYYIEAFDQTERAPSRLGSAQAPWVARVGNGPAADRRRIATYGTLGLGVVGVGTGVFYTLSAAKTDAKADDEPSAKTADEYRDYADDYRRNAAIAYGVGGAALVAGGVLFYLDWREKTHNGDATARASRIYPVISPQGAQVIWRMQF